MTIYLTPGEVSKKMKEILADEHWKKQAMDYLVFATQIFPSDTFEKEESIEMFLSGVLFIYTLSQFGESSNEIN